MRIYPLLAGMLWLWSPAGQAIVNMENLHLGPPTDGLEGELEFSASGASGNTDKRELGAGTRLQWRHGRSSEILLLDYSYGQVNNITNTDRALLHTRHIRDLTQRLSWELFGQLQRDEFARMAYRGLYGGGLRVNLLPDRPRQAALAGVGAFYEHEIQTDNPPLPADSTRTVRTNLYLVLKFEFGPDARLVSSTYYQPDYRRGADFRLLESAVLEMDLSKRLSLRLSLTVNHDSEPPAGVEPTDTQYRTGLKLSF